MLRITVTALYSLFPLWLISYFGGVTEPRHSLSVTAPDRSFFNVLPSLSFHIGDRETVKNFLVGQQTEMNRK